MFCMSSCVSKSHGHVDSRGLLFCGGGDGEGDACGGGDGESDACGGGDGEGVEGVVEGVGDEFGVGVGDGVGD